MTDTATNFDLDDRTLVPAQNLWTIHDVARFLRRCENTARNLVKQPGMPQPVFFDGAGALWDPRSWWAWADEQAKAKASKTKRAGKVGVAAGKATRV